eukprot:m.45935 g.45935  ORF g.45935 m.45935 type:complete len:106 (-) comp10908_c0_seq4:5254-5571(-)
MSTINNSRGLGVDECFTCTKEVTLLQSTQVQDVAEVFFKKTKHERAIYLTLGKLSAAGCNAGGFNPCNNLACTRNHKLIIIIYEIIITKDIKKEMPSETTEGKHS